MRRLAALAFGLALAASPAAAQSVMKMGNATINDVQHEWQKVFKTELEKRVGDAVKVEIYPASQLGPIPQMAEGVAFGTLESFISPTSFLTSLDPTFQIFDVPGLFRSPQELDAVMHDPTYRDHVETMFLDRGLRVIGAIYNSPVLVLTKQPVTDVSQMKGLKIRTFASPLQIKPMEAVGAIATPLPLSEVVPQLQSGGIDGMLAGMPILTAFKYYDIAKNVTELDFSFIVSLNIVNEDWFQSQTDDGEAGDPRGRTRRGGRGLPVGGRQRRQGGRGLEGERRHHQRAAEGRAHRDARDLHRDRRGRCERRSAHGGRIRAASGGHQGEAGQLIRVSQRSPPVSRQITRDGQRVAPATRGSATSARAAYAAPMRPHQRRSTAISSPFGPIRTTVPSAARRSGTVSVAPTATGPRRAEYQCARAISQASGTSLRFSMRNR